MEDVREPARLHLGKELRQDVEEEAEGGLLLIGCERSARFSKGDHPHEGGPSKVVAPVESKDEEFPKADKRPASVVMALEVGDELVEPGVMLEVHSRPLADVPNVAQEVGHGFVPGRSPA